MPDFPQDVVDEVDGKTPPAGGPTGPKTDEQDIEQSGEYNDPAAGQEDGEGAPEILTQDQQAIMHRISEAIAMLVYGKDTNRDIIKMALLGPQGVVKAVAAIMDKVVMAAKPGIPRDLLPLAAFAALVMLQDFLESMGEPGIKMQEVLPMLIDELGDQFQASPIEKAQLRRLKSKAGRGFARQAAGMHSEEGEPQAQESAEPPQMQQQEGEV